MWRTSILALLAMGGSAQAGFYFHYTLDSVSGIPHFRVINLFATNDRYGTGAGLWALELNYNGDATVWSQRTTTAGLGADILNCGNVPWGSWIRVGNQPTLLAGPSPSASSIAWTEGMTALTVAAASLEPDLQPRQQIARLVFANQPRFRIVGRIGGSAGPAVPFEVISPFGYAEHSPAPEPPFTLTMDRPVKVINRIATGTSSELRPVTVVSTSRDPGQVAPSVTLESISPHLVDNVEWLVDEPTRKVFRLVKLTAEDWQLGTIVFSSPSGLGYRHRQTFTLIAPEPAILGVLASVFLIGCARCRCG